MRVLLVTLEAVYWNSARHLSYATFLGMEEGLRANGVECWTVTSPWLRWVPDIYRGKRFDQVWLELFHAPATVGEETLARIAELAPVRLGLIADSLGYDSSDYDADAGVLHMKAKRDRVKDWIKYVTHVAAADETDAQRFNDEGRVRSLWWPQAIPRRFIRERVAPPSSPRAVFCGSLGYGGRPGWVRCPELDGLLIHQRSPEAGTVYPLMFDILHAAVRALLLLDAPGVGLVRTICAPPLTPLRRPTVMRRLLPAYLAALRRFRCRCFTRWLELMQAGSAVVHLPSFFKAYSGRVFEGMAAGRPVISWDIPNRPLNRALFRDGEEILLFDPNSPNHLASQIRRISSDPALAVRIAENARMKLERSHTVETRVRQLLRWIASGEQPGYLSQA